MGHFKVGVREKGRKGGKHERKERDRRDSGKHPRNKFMVTALVDSTEPYVLQIQSHVSFLHEELLKLPSFPRKALESEFGLHSGVMGQVSVCTMLAS